MSQSDRGTSGLNNYLQRRGLEASVSWLDSTTGPDHTPTWTSVCKVAGQVRGRGTGTHKHIARDNAANEALQSLMEEENQAS